MHEESKNVNETVNEPTPPTPENSPLNPELIRRVASMLASGVDAPHGAQDALEPTENRTEGAAAPNTDALSAFLSDPALLQRLPQIIAVIKPLFSASFSPPPTNSTEPPAPQKGRIENNRDRLLLSLKPFLSPSRCEAIDTMLRLAQLGELFGQLK